MVGARHILVIEDDAETAEQLIDCLQTSGYSVDLAADGEDGLKRARSADYVVMTVDRMLPRIDGIEVIRRLRDEGVMTPALILSALGEIDDRVRVLPDGSHLLIGRKIEDLHGLVEKIVTVLAWGAGLFLILAAAAGISTSRRSVARIEAINATSLNIMRAGLGERIPLRGTDDEWDGLARNLNSMLDRIEELMEAVRQVSDNVAHDLRTPLTRMRGRLEKGCNQRLGVSQYQSLLNDTIIELDEILSRFSSILRISQIEMRNQQRGFHDIDLAQIAREVVELFDPSAEEKAVKLELLANEEVPVFGDRDLLFDALSNLVDNAIKHGADNNAVMIEVCRGASGPVVTVADHGPGIPADERRNVFKRFYRLEHSRNSPGSGLGLSLVAAVANLHGAQIELADNVPGLRIELRFPSPENAAHYRSSPALAPLP